MGKYMPIAVAAVILISGCARVPFTQKLRRNYNLTASVLKGVQYYISDTISLSREIHSKDIEVSEKHGIKVIKEKNLEKIIIKAGTPGIVEKVGSKTLAVSFEPGKRIYFGYAAGFGGKEGKYILLSQRRAIKESFGTDGLSYWVWKMKYGKKRYRAVARAFPVYLKVDMKAFKRVVKTARTVPGRVLR